MDLKCKTWMWLFEILVAQSLKHLLKTVTLENLINHRSLLHDGKLIATGQCSSPQGIQVIPVCIQEWEPLALAVYHLPYIRIAELERCVHGEFCPFIIFCSVWWPENTKMVDVYLFLFDEFLLITKIKRNKKVGYFTVLIAISVQ